MIKYLKKELYKLKITGNIKNINIKEIKLEGI